MDTGKRVTELRELAGLTKYKLAKIIRVSPSLITKIEKNNAKPSLDSLERICTAVNISMADFFITDTRKKPSIPRTSIDNKSKDCFVNQFNSLTNSDKKIVKDLITRLLRN